MVPVAGPFFNENTPLRNLPIVTNQVAGAMDIQKYFDEIAWIAASGDGVSYAPHIRKEPLTGMSPKSILINFGKGDESAPNPRTTQLLRAGGLCRRGDLLSQRPRQNKVLAEVKSLSPYRRFVIALHSPDVIVETGLLMYLPEKTALKLACGVQRDTFSGPI